jgi:hypothetical protein
VRHTGHADDLMIYACDLCHAQFTVTIPRTKGASVPSSPASRAFFNEKKTTQR